MNRVRLATEAEVDSIKETTDLENDTCLVYALDTQKGTPIAVRRLCVEIDPLVSPPDFGIKLKSLFIRDLETILWGQGVRSYYFNIDATDLEWQDYVKHWGAEQVSGIPMLRFKRTL